MFSSQFLFLPARSQLSSFNSSFCINKRRSARPNDQIFIFGVGHGSFRRRRRGDINIQAIDKESQQFEIDPVKAKEALKKLDQQLQSLSDKKTKSPEIKASDVKFKSEPMMMEEPPEMSGSFLGYSAFILLLFTLFYNLLFYTVIKPSIDGDNSFPTSAEKTVSSDNPDLQFSSSMPDAIFQR